MILTNFDRVMVYILVAFGIFLAGSQITHWERNKWERAVELDSPQSAPVPLPGLPSASSFLMSHYSRSVQEGTADGVTATGAVVKENWTVAVDPKVIPLGSVIYIPELKDLPNGGIFKSEDTGGAVKGRRIDRFVSSRDEAFRLGVMRVHVAVFK